MYMYSVNEPWSDSERYMHAALMELHSSSQNHLIWGWKRTKTLKMHKMVTAVKAGKLIFGQSGSFDNDFTLHLLLAGALAVSI